MLGGFGSGAGGFLVEMGGFVEEVLGVELGQLDCGVGSDGDVGFRLGVGGVWVRVFVVKMLVVVVPFVGRVFFSQLFQAFELHVHPVFHILKVFLSKPFRSKKIPDALDFFGQNRRLRFPEIFSDLGLGRLLPQAQLPFQRSSLDNWL